MGLVASVITPTVSNTLSSRILLGPEKPENVTNSSQNESKYDNLTSPIQNELGPSPGNKPSPNPIIGAPVIHPPSDTVSKAPDNSAYDTLSMTPEVDWNKKMMMKTSNGIKK